jgi:hypothetical protein
MKKLLLCVAVTAAFFTGPASASQFNFAYRFQGERAVQPLQVFDDGVNTYFQFRSSNRVVPTIVAEVNGETYVANYATYGPYIVVPGVASSYRLQFETLTATVIQSGGRQTIAAPPPANPAAQTPMIATATNADFRPAVQRYVGYGPVEPIAGGARQSTESRTTMPADVAGILGGDSKTFRIPFVLDSAKMTPAAMKAITQALRGPGEIGKVVVVGRDDVKYRDGVAAERSRNIATALERYGVPVSRISQRVGIPREDEDPRHPTSDIEVTRVVLAQPEQVLQPRAETAAAPLAPAPTAAVSAVAMIRQGLATLVKFGWLPQGRADAAMEVITRGMPRSFAGDAAPDAVAHPAAARGAQPSSGAAMATSQETWTMTPADGTALAGLAKWAAHAGWEFESRAGVDYPITKTIKVQGDARTAVEYVMTLLKGAKRPLREHMEGNKLVIEG